MLDALIERMPMRRRVALIQALLGLAVFVAGYVTNYWVRAAVVRQTVRVERSWGTPSQTLAGSAVNPQLAGLTCDLYAARRTLVCHP